MLCSILRNRKEQGLQTFISFIDFKKAFDSVDRNLLMYKLSKIGIVGKMYNAISSMYTNPRSRIVLTSCETDYFDCPSGVKQGDSISPTLFSIFINDLACELNDTNLRIEQDEFQLSALLYADDIVLIAENELNLQGLLNIVENWCNKWQLEINLTKTNFMHVRKKRKARTNVVFKFGSEVVQYCTSYKYLGTTIDEHINFETTVSILVESAGKALGSIITKMIKNGGFPYNLSLIHI